jgi:hypothetical protein
MNKTTLPNSTAALVMGIISIPTCFCYGVLGLPLGIIAIILGSKAQNLDRKDPGLYKGAGNAQAGLITGIVGTVLNLIMLTFVIWIFMSLDWDQIENQEDARRAIEKLFGQ